MRAGSGPQDLDLFFCLPRLDRFFAGRILYCRYPRKGDRRYMNDYSIRLAALGAMHWLVRTRSPLENRHWRGQEMTIFSPLWYVSYKPYTVSCETREIHPLQENLPLPLDLSCFVPCESNSCIFLRSIYGSCRKETENFNSLKGSTTCAGYRAWLEPGCTSSGGSAGFSQL